jgi:hypothetical protein
MVEEWYTTIVYAYYMYATVSTISENVRVTGKPNDMTRWENKNSNIVFMT